MSNTIPVPDVGYQGFGARLAGPFVVSGGLPTVPTTSLTTAAFATTAYVRGAAGELVYVAQEAAPITLDVVNGIWWLALARDTSTTFVGWTRTGAVYGRAGTHYLVQQSATQPAQPVGTILLAQVTVAATIISVIRDRRAFGGSAGVDVAALGLSGDDTVDAGAFLQPYVTSGIQAFRFGTGTFRFTTGLTIAHNIVLEGRSSSETIFQGTTGQDTVFVDGAFPGWQNQPGEALCLISRIGFQGGRHAIRTRNLTHDGFAEGFFKVMECRFLETEDYALFLESSTYYSFVAWNRCFNSYGFAKVRDNTETKFFQNTTECSITGAASYYLDGSHRVIIDSEEFLGGKTNTHPDIYIQPRNFDNSLTNIPSSAIVTITHCRFGSELDIDLSIRPKIVVENTDNDLAAWQCTFTDSIYQANNGMTIATATRAANVVTLTIEMPTIPRSGGTVLTNHGAGAGQLLYVVGTTNPSVNGEYTITSVTPTTITYPSVGANFGVTAIGGTVFSGQQIAIALFNPLAQCFVDGNYFQNVAYAISDQSPHYANTPHGYSGQCTWGPNNRLSGPGGRGGALELSNRFQGFGFERITPRAASAMVAVNPDLLPVQALFTQNRVITTDLTAWVLNGCTVVGGQTSGLPDNTAAGVTTSAFVVTRTGGLNGFAVGFASELTTFTLQEGISVLLDTITVPRSSGYIRFRAKGGTSSVLTVGIIDKTNLRLICCQTVTLPVGAWADKWYQIPFRYTVGFDNSNTFLFFIPGDWLLQNSSVYLDKVQVCDVIGDWVANAGPQEALDARVGNIWAKDVAISQLRLYPGNTAPVTVAVLDGSLGTGAGATIAIAGQSMAGVITASTGVGPAAAGAIVLAIPRGLPGTMSIHAQLENANVVLNARATVRVNARVVGASSVSISFLWDNNAVALTAGTATAFRLNYWIIPTTTDGLG